MKLPCDDHHLEIEQEELLVSTRRSGSRRTSVQRKDSFTTQRLAFNIAGGVLGFLVVLLVILALPSSRDKTALDKDINSNDLPNYKCPASVAKSLNDVGDNLDWYYRDDAKLSNTTTLKDLKKANMDGWDMSYVMVKRLLRPWKEMAYVPNVQSGDSIYESACGSGLNLLLTTEILREHNIVNVTVYGNDYVAPSVAIANDIVWNSNNNNKARRGNICVGDSSNLSFVPSNAFDFVYTGYIDPLVDPLSLSKPKTSDNQKLAKSINYCFSNDTKKQELAQQEQVAQQDWYASWVSEMIRIAKPGAPIVAESNSESVCKHFSEYPDIHDWGGVDKEWWMFAISTYQWNVDPGSLIIEDEPTTKQWKYPRYHVLMRKKSK